MIAFVSPSMPPSLINTLSTGVKSLQGLFDSMVVRLGVLISDIPNTVLVNIVLRPLALLEP